MADLVFEHFKKHPNRSLGVVTFSEAQQNAVDAVIRQKRLENPSFNKYFIEDNEEPFFIKTLKMYKVTSVTQLYLVLAMLKIIMA